MKRLLRLFFADLRWTFENLVAWIKKIFILPGYTIPSGTPDVQGAISVMKDIAIPMRDNVNLYADIYSPPKEGPFPVILIRMPYGKSEFYCLMPASGKYWAKKGYVCVIQDVRGKFASEGVWEPFVNEAKDGYDTIDWISKQPWCDGNIGMTGESYYGYTQWAAATEGHPNLKCIAPGDTATDIHGVWIFNGGAHCLNTLGTWAHKRNGNKSCNYHRLDYRHLPLIGIGEDAAIPSHYFKEWIRHPTRDQYWDAINHDHRLNQVEIPILHWGGWYDVFLKGTINDWHGVRTRSDDPRARENQWLLIAPTDHNFMPVTTGKIGKVDVGEDAWSWDRVQMFFDYWLKGLDNGWGERPRVEFFVIGKNEWRFENEWPLERTVYTNFYLHSQGNANTVYGDGTLDRIRPQSEPYDRYDYDPGNPITITLSSDLWSLADELKDRQEVENREDVLAYKSNELEEDLELSGPISVTLFAASSARDTDFTATLVDVFPDGYTHLIQEGIIRARFRDPDAEPSLLEPGKVYQFNIDLWATSYVIKKGHRLLVEISSSNFNRYDRNLNTGNQLGTDDLVIKATQSIYHTEAYPSHITLPVIPN